MINKEVSNGKKKDNNNNNEDDDDDERKNIIMMPTATLGLLVYPKDFDVCLQPCSFLSISPSRVCSLQETNARNKMEKKEKDEENE